MGFLSDLIIGSAVGEMLGSKEGGVVGALLEKNGSLGGAIAGGIIGSALFPDKEKPVRDDWDDSHYDD
jgi:outer membrane lipoprotein SlyB